MTRRTTLRIMIFNVGYLSGITAFSEYLTKFNRVIAPQAPDLAAVSAEVAALVEKVDPDILFLAEINPGAPLHAVETLFTESHVDCKYGPGSPLLGVLPRFKKNSNGVFLRRPLPVTKLFLKSGMKKLVYRVDIDDRLSAFFCHAALDGRSRHKQFAELARLAQAREQAIIAGDFNAFGGLSEFHDLLHSAGLHIAGEPIEKTFPSRHPAIPIDLFLVSDTLHAVRVDALEDILLSDHLPVIADIDLTER